MSLSLIVSAFPRGRHFHGPLGRTGQSMSASREELRVLGFFPVSLACCDLQERRLGGQATVEPQLEEGVLSWVVWLWTETGLLTAVREHRRVRST